MKRIDRRTAASDMDIAETSIAELGLADTSVPAEIEWPGWVRQSNGWWVGAFSLSFGAVSFLYFVLLNDQLKHHRKWVVAAALLAPFLLWAFIAIRRNIAVAYERLNQYISLRELLVRRTRGLTTVSRQLSDTQLTVRELLEQLIDSRKVEIQRVQLFKSRVCLTLKRKRNLRLSVGDRVRVIDLKDGELMGTFEVTQTHPSCTAEALQDINPVWSGYIHQSGSDSAPPGAVAVLIEKQERTNYDD